MHTPQSRLNDLAKRQERRQLWLCENGPCKCGSWLELEVHHKDPTTKISHNVWSWKVEKLMNELSKCEVMCDKCHNEFHSAQRRKLVHGLSGYDGIHKCRCLICKQAKSVANKKRVRKRVSSNGKTTAFQAENAVSIRLPAPLLARHSRGFSPNNLSAGSESGYTS